MGRTLELIGFASLAVAAVMILSLPVVIWMR